MFSLKTKLGLKKGSPEAFQEVFRVLYPRLKGYCKLIVSDENEVEDIIQDCFIKLWEKRTSIDSGKNIESLVFVILRNRCLNHLKAKQLKMESIPFEKLKYSELQHLYQLDLIKKEEEKLEEILWDSFHDAVNSLPEKMKSVFVQCKLQGIKQKDVAKSMGISLKTVEKHISKAKILIEDQIRMKNPTVFLLILTLLFLM